MLKRFILTGMLLFALALTVNTFAIVWTFPNWILNKETVNRILVITDGSGLPEDRSSKEIMKLYNLLGHFNAIVTILPSKQYTSNILDKYDILFYTGFQPKVKPPKIMMQVIMHTKKTVVWMNGGLLEQNDAVFKRKLGFTVDAIDSTGNYLVVNSQGKQLNRQKGMLFHVRIDNNKIVRILASASNGAQVQLFHIS